MDLDSVLYDVVDSTKDFYIFTSVICRSFIALDIEGSFNLEQVDELVSMYLKKLSKAGLLIESKYPHTNVSRYRKTDLFYQSHNKIPETNVELRSKFLLDLKMQRALSNFEILKYNSELEDYSKNGIDKTGIENSEEKQFRITKEKSAFIKSKLCVINILLEIYQFELGEKKSL